MSSRGWWLRLMLGLVLSLSVVGYSLDAVCLLGPPCDPCCCQYCDSPGQVAHESMHGLQATPPSLNPIRILPLPPPAIVVPSHRVVLTCRPAFRPGPLGLRAPPRSPLSA
ncbi:MAG: hypothetical protein AB1758_06780 [Candidatus Eremiobacterota bacterium]